MRLSNSLNGRDRSCGVRKNRRSNRPAFKAALLAGLGGLGVLNSVGLVHAAVVTLAANDGSGVSSFNTAGNWSNALAPSSGNTYNVGTATVHQMRTPPGAGNQTFLGAALNLGGGVNTSYGILTCKASDGTGDVITVNNLTLNAGVLQDGGTPGGASLTWVLAGSNMVVGPAGFSVDNAGTGVTAFARDLILSANLTGSGPLTGGLNQAVSINGGYLALTGNNSAWSGSELITGGTLMVGNGSSGGSLGTGAIDNDGTLAFNLSGGYTASNVVTVDTGNTGTFTNFVSGTTGTVGTLTSAGNVVVNGPGIVAFAGGASITGTTTINAGADLMVSGGAFSPVGNITMVAGSTLDASGTTSGGFSLASGQTLAGAGTIKGNVSSGGIIAIGSGTTVGTLAFANNLSLTNGGTLTAYFNGSTNAAASNDLITVAGNLSLTGTTILSLNTSSTPAAGSVYHLIQYGGTLTGSSANILYGSRAATVDTSVPGYVNLDFTGLGPASLTWNGTSSSNWDVQTTANWFNGSSNDKFYQQDSVTFDDSKPGVLTSINTVGTLLPGAVTVNSATNNYTFVGSGHIGGTAALTKLGSGTLTISTSSNSYTGVTTIGTTTTPGGTLVLTGYNPALSQIVLHNLGTLQLQANSGNIVGGIAYPMSNTSAANFSTAPSFQFGDGFTGSVATLQLRSDSNVYFAGTKTGNSTGNGSLDYDVNDVTSGVTGKTLEAGSIGTYYTTVNVTGGNGYGLLLDGVFNANGAPVTFNAASAPLTIGSAGINNSSNSTFSGANTTLVTGNISGTAVTVSGTGTVTLSGTNTYTGTVSIQNGTLAVATIAATGVAQSLGEGAAIAFGSGTTTAGLLEYTGSTSVSDTRALTLSGGGGGYKVDTAAVNVTQSGAVSGAGQFIKTGPGSLTLAGSSYTYTGVTNILAGKLVVPSTATLSTTAGFNVATGATLDISGAPAFTLGSGQYLGGTGTVNGSYNHVAGTLVAGNTTAPGSLTFNNNLNISGGSATFNVFGASNASSYINVLGNLNISSTTPFTLNFVTTPVAGTTYELFGYNTLTAGSAANLQPTNRGVTVETNVPNEITVLYTGYANLTWAAPSGGAGNWDVEQTTNWSNNGGPTPNDVFYPGDAVSFGDTIPNVNTTVTLQANVSPGSITVNSATNNYTFAGNYSITGSTGLLMSGTSILTVSNSNTYTGTTNVSAGIVVVTNATGGGLGNGPLLIGPNGTVQLGSTASSTAGQLTNSTITDNGTLIFAQSVNNSFLSEVIGGTGNVTINGNGVDLGTNTYTGTTTLLAGPAFPYSNTPFGTSTVTTNGGYVYSAAVSAVLANNFVFNGFSFEAGGARTTTVTGSVTLASNASVNADGGATLAFTGPVTGPTFNLSTGGGGTVEFGGTVNLGSTGSLVVNGGTLGFIPAATVTQSVTATITDGANVGTVEMFGPGTTVLNGNNNYSGQTVIAGGELLITNGNALGQYTSGGSNTSISGGAGTTGDLALSGGITTPESILLGGRSGTSATSPHILNVSGTNTINGNITTTTGGNQYTLESDSGTLIIAGNITPIAGTGARFLNLQGAANGVIGGQIVDGTAQLNINMYGPGTWTLTSLNNLQNYGVSYSGLTSVYGGNLVYAPGNPGGIQVQALTGGLSIYAGAQATAALPASSGTRQLLVIGPSSATTSYLTIGTTGKLDLTANDADLPGASLSAVTALVAQGYNLTGGANWQGSGGIISSAAAADTSHLTALGVISNNQSGTQLYGNGVSFDGTSPGLNDVLIKYTYFGDANLDGKVDGSDYSLIDAGYASNRPGFTGTVLSGWYNGDFNYDGVIDGSDYALIDNAFNNQNQTVGASAIVATATAQVAGPTAVPEPASLGLLALAGAGLIGRRRRA
jgi:autotransporter-associated beta strand protein